mmetsp:Transcript_99595/g.253141  ORF Transcript_99595/g.253141 Transcript_99595/m.253141 type:complete len:237 (+) Transcript_99595:89-799(+)
MRFVALPNLSSGLASSWPLWTTPSIEFVGASSSSSVAPLVAQGAHRGAHASVSALDASADVDDGENRLLWRLLTVQLSHQRGSAPWNGLGVSSSASASVFIDPQARPAVSVAATVVPLLAGFEPPRREVHRRRRLPRRNAMAWGPGMFPLPTHAAAAPVQVRIDPAFVECHTIMSRYRGGGDVQCVICVDDLSEGDVVRTLPCGHVYHKECVDSWLRRSVLCCLCMQAINGSPATQ